MNQIELSRLYPYQRADGATIFRGKCGYNGILKVIPNPAFDESDARSAPYIAVLEQQPPKETAVPFRGQPLAPPPLASVQRRPMAQPPQPQHRAALPSHDYIEAEIVSNDPFAD